MEKLAEEIDECKSEKGVNNFFNSVVILRLFSRPPVF